MTIATVPPTDDAVARPRRRRPAPLVPLPFETGYPSIDDLTALRVDKASPIVPTGRRPVCVVSTESPGTVGGLATYIRGLAEELTDDGHTVTAVCRFDRPTPAGFCYADVQTPREVLAGGVPTRVVAPHPRWRPILGRLRHFTGRGRLRHLAVRTYLAAMRERLDAVIPLGVNGIHYVGVGYELLGFAALAVARRRGVAFSVWPAVHPGQWGDSPLDLDLYRQADTVFVQSDFEREYLREKGVKAERMVKVMLPPSPGSQGGDGEAFRRRHGLGNRKIVLFIGRKSHGKGYHVTRQAMAEVQEAVPDVCLVAIGPDGDPPYPPVPHGVLLDLGVAPDREKADALAACDVLCVPSAHESYGIVYVEAMSYGKPIICGEAGTKALSESTSRGNISVGIDEVVVNVVLNLS